MNWITNIVRPRIKGLMGGKDRAAMPARCLRQASANQYGIRA